jgi:hypothetical protein
MPYEPCLFYQIAPDWILGCDPTRTQSPHPDGMNVAVGDGSVRYVSGSLDHTIWERLCDPRDQFVINSDW